MIMFNDLELLTMNKQVSSEYDGSDINNDVNGDSDNYGDDNNDLALFIKIIKSASSKISVSTIRLSFCLVTSFHNSFNSLITFHSTSIGFSVLLPDSTGANFTLIHR